MASDKTNVMRVLEQHKIAYKPHEYLMERESYRTFSTSSAICSAVR